MLTFSSTNKGAVAVGQVEKMMEANGMSQGAFVPGELNANLMKSIRADQKMSALYDEKTDVVKDYFLSKQIINLFE